MSASLRLFLCGHIAALLAACTGGGVDAGTDAGGIAAKLSAIRSDIFEPNCSANSCHGGANPVNGLDLASDGVHARLVDQDSTIAGRKYVVPGEPTESLLYVVVKDGLENGGIRKMPPGVSLSDEKVNAIRDWIEAGAADD